VKQSRVSILISITLLVALAACQSLQSAEPVVTIVSAPMITSTSPSVDTSLSTPTPDGLHIEIVPDAQPATRLSITETLDGRLASQGLMHALIVPSDLSTLYHEHPQELGTGHFALDVPALSTGEYDIWIEITIGSGHDNAILNRFTMQLQAARPSTDAAAARVTLKPTKLDIQPPGALSHLEFLIALDGKPVSHFGQFVGVEVHEFAISANREWFKHDHAHPIGSGKIDAHFEFPKAGQYIVFFQPTIITEASREIRPMLRHTIAVR
jgi:hypothetical protein